MPSRLYNLPKLQFMKITILMSDYWIKYNLIKKLFCVAIFLMLSRILVYLNTNRYLPIMCIYVLIMFINTNIAIFK